MANIDKYFIQANRTNTGRSNRMSTIHVSSSGLTGSIRREDTDSAVLNLIEKASRLGMTDDIREMVDDVDRLKEILNKKAAELDILEILAMQSDDENISELREQLFATVKLIHSDVIQEMVSNRDRDSDLIIEDTFWNQSIDRNKKKDSQGLIDKVRGAWHNHKEVRKLHKLAKRRIKESMQNKSSGISEMQADNAYN